MAGGDAVSVVRLAMNLDVRAEEDAQSDMAMLNAMVGDTDLDTAKATIYERAFLVACLLRFVQEDHPGLDANEFIGNWGLKLALEEDPV